MPLQLVRNDITKMKVDAIVNAANSSLLGGGGVDGAIHQAAGPDLLEECRTLGGCATGEAKITKGYRLPAKYVIHTVGPIWEGGSCGEEALLRSCYRNSLELTVEHHCTSVAFPLISAGVYGYPKGQALRVAMDTISGFLMDHDQVELEVWLVLFGRDTLGLGQSLFPGLQEFIDDHYVEEHEDRSYEDRRRQQLLAKQSMSRPVASESQEVLERPANALPAHKKAAKTGAAFGEAAADYPGASHKLDDLVSRLDESFTQMVLRKIDEAGITDAQCYKRANLDRKLFSKIRSDLHYKPSKKTAVALAIALELDLKQTNELLRKAGFALSRSSVFDVIIEYFISRGRYNIFEINEALFSYDQVTLS